MSGDVRALGGPTTAGQSTAVADLLGDRELYIVSNRQPYSHTEDGDRIAVDRPTGGLTAGLDPVMQRTGGTWIAWGDSDADSRVVDGDDCVAVPPDGPRYRLRRVWLTDEQVRGYYSGFSNQVLWPVCHSALTKVRCGAASWRHYRRVNERFADAVVDQTGGRPLVWFQDYHLALAPRLARSRLPDGATLLHFWHIPWPSWDTFRACPHGEEVIEGLLANDLLGFHVERYRTNFLRCVRAAIDDASVDLESGTVDHDGRVTSVVAVPMGVPFERIQRAAEDPGAESFWPAFRQEQPIPAGAKVAVGVDRLDYTKGLVERLHALERLWESRPGWRGRLTYVQNASESRSSIPDYRAVQRRVADEIDRINRRFGGSRWQPIVYFTDRLSQAALSDLYRHADLAIVSPVRDGMNLVSQEYVAAQVDEDGILVLSDQAGVHDGLGEHAVSVRPADTAGFADALDRALRLPAGERQRRMRHLRRWVSDHDLDAWLEATFRAAGEVASVGTRSLQLP